jgi:histidine phosphotransferase ChpT
MIKDKVKLLLNLVASAITALPRGGDIEVTVGDRLEAPSFSLRCRGTGARPPQYLAEFVNGGEVPALDAMTIQAYYTWRLAGSSGMKLDILKDGNDIVLSAKAA